MKRAEHIPEWDNAIIGTLEQNKGKWYTAKTLAHKVVSNGGRMVKITRATEEERRNMDYIRYRCKTLALDGQIQKRAKGRYLYEYSAIDTDL